MAVLQRENSTTQNNKLITGSQMSDLFGTDSEIRADLKDSNPVRVSDVLEGRFSKE